MTCIQKISLVFREKYQIYEVARVRRKIAYSGLAGETRPCHNRGRPVGIYVVFLCSYKFTKYIQRPFYGNEHIRNGKKFVLNFGKIIVLRHQLEVGKNRHIGLCEREFGSRLMSPSRSIIPHYCRFVNRQNAELHSSECTKFGAPICITAIKKKGVSPPSLIFNCNINLLLLFILFFVTNYISFVVRRIKN